MPEICQKTNLTYAFAEMRRQGIVAKQNFMDCVNEAGMAIAGEATLLTEQGSVIHGCCFYTSQDEIWKKKGLDFYLCYCTLETSTLSTEDVGILVIRCLVKYKVNYFWTGDPDCRILIEAESIRKMPGEEAKACKMPDAEIPYRMLDKADRHYWAVFSGN